MFFSVNELYKACQTNGAVRADIADYLGMSYGVKINKSGVRNYVRACKQAIVDRHTRIDVDDGDAIYLGKWFRPWEIVPSLANFRAPDGEYAVGVEVEMGFTSREASRNIAQTIQHWKHIALDYEGGTYPIEATFPPVLYSKYGPKSQASRYLKLLAAPNSGVAQHSAGALIGTHVNVSKGGARIDRNRLYDLSAGIALLTASEKAKYFGRGSPYGYAYNQGDYVEFKMFNSTTDWKKLRRYVDVAVALATLLYGDGTINPSSVAAACEAGYSKRNKKTAANVSNQANRQEALSLAA